MCGRNNPVLFSWRTFPVNSITLIVVEWISASLSMVAALSCGPMQIHMNMERQYCGQPFFVMILSLFVVFFRALTYTLQKQWKMAAPDYLGTLVCTILLCQYWAYHM